MKQDKSYGVIPLKREGSYWEVFLVQHSRALFWGFPKGHAEGTETPLAAAKRELYEETALEIKHVLREEPFEEHYFFTFKGEKISKTVFLFAAEVTGTVNLQEAEISGGKWVPLLEASSSLTYPADKQVLEEAITLIHLI